MLLVMVFVIGLLVVFVGGYQIAEKRMLAPKKRAEAIAPPPSDLPALACEALVTRVFEQRLVDAGIMEAIDMTVCEDATRCKDCQPTVQAIAARDRELNTKKRELRQIPRPPKGKGGGSPKFAKRGEQFIRITENGKNTREIPWPESVPSYASVTVDNNYNGYKGNTRTLMFKWTDEATGHAMSKTMLVPVLSWQP